MNEPRLLQTKNSYVWKLFYVLNDEIYQGEENKPFRLENSKKISKTTEKLSLFNSESCCYETYID